MTIEHHTLDFYTQPGRMTSPGRYAALFDNLPQDVAKLTEVAQGLIIHEHIAPNYGVTLSDEQRGSVHIRPVEHLLERLVAEDDRPLTSTRAPGARLAGNCRHFTVLMVAMLRSQGVPARARCGFGGYFGTNSFEDHWVCEYWNTGEARWVLVDAQIDQLQRGLFKPDFDLMDVPRTGFVIAGDAWAQYRAGTADPSKFGLSILNETGDWWIAGNLIRDMAALNNMEMLPWDGWGAMPGPEEPIDDSQLLLFDKLAMLTQAPDSSFAELQALYANEQRVHVPATVFNAVLNREETL